MKRNEATKVASARKSIFNPKNTVMLFASTMVIAMATIAPAAAADIQPRACDPDLTTWYEIDSKTSYHVPSAWNGTLFKDGPGGNMTVSVTKSGTITATVTAGFEAEIGGIIAQAKASVSASISTSVNVTVGHTYSHDIASGKYGHLQYGSWGYKTNWSKWKSIQGGCSSQKIASGTATLPTSETGWKYWETSS